VVDRDKYCFEKNVYNNDEMQKAIPKVNEIASTRREGEQDEEGQGGGYSAGDDPTMR